MKKIYLFVLIATLFSCASPQKLVDRAIKKDPTIVSGYNDTVTINKYFVDSVLVTKNDTSYFEKIIKVVEFDTIISTFQINIERKKTRQEIRKNAKLERINARKDSKIQELELKNERIQARLDAKTDKKKVKEDGKTARTTTRQENKRNGFFWFWWGLLIGCGAGIAFKYLLRYLKTFLLK
jgi:hypothetical protein